MGGKTKKQRVKKPKKLTVWIKSRSIWQKIGLIIVVLVFLNVAVMFSVGQWYIWSKRNEPVKVGATFVPNYAKYFGLDPQDTLQAMMDELGLRQFRFVSYWKDIEKAEGTYDFSELDWQFDMAEKYGADVSLAIGLRQPRWPECHEPAWAKGRPISEWEHQLTDFITATVNRYKDRSVLKSYQLENEFFMSVFGECTDFRRERLVAETELVKNLDPDTELIISRSNNWGGLPIGEPRPDTFAISVYKRVWDKTLTKRYFEYPYPAWFYASLAGGGKILTGKDMIIHELQAEAWLPDTGEFMMNDIKSIPEQNKSLNAERLKDRIKYGEETGMKSAYLWGVEWWYWRKVKAGDSSLWSNAQVEIQRIAEQNEKLKTKN